MDTERIITNICQTLASDPLSQKHLGSTEDTKWQTNPDGLLLFDERIYVPEIQDLHLQVLQFKHDHILSGHFGINKTFELVRRDFNWPGMRSYIKDYCKSCTTCMHSKPQRHKPYGLLKQLPVPENPWNLLSMDFIEQLPASSEFTAILVIVNHFSKQGIFIPTTDTITLPKLAELFVLHIFSKHGIPSHVTSDRGSEFVSHFWRSLGKALDMKLHYTSGYHPEGDGQTKHTNQTLEQYLHVYCNYQQDNWASLLPLAEFAYNNAPSTTTGILPFFDNKGYHPNLAIHSERDLTSSRAQDFIVDLDKLHQELCRAILATQQAYQTSADTKRLPPPDFKVGNLAFVKAQFFRTTHPTTKLTEKFLGPFEIIARPGTHSVTLKLPDYMKAVHPIFHVSMLEPTSPNTIPNHSQTPLPPVIIDGEPEFEVTKVLHSKIDNRCKACKLLYLVWWAGYEGTDEETSWILASEVDHTSELVQDFHKSYPSKPGPLPIS